ncbi:MAG TPA: AraC family transcriptional regulator [Candidatus Binatia bacterium]|nr:AraC family transcriptional regulator [Candidatus Binatia bacterium]
MGVGSVRGKPMISIAATAGLLEAITAAGGNPDEILHDLGVDRSVFSKSAGFIPCSVFAGILKEAARTTGDDCFGLHFGESFHPKNIGPLAYVALNSPTIGAGIQNVERYLHVYDSSAKWFFTAEGNRGYIRYVLTDVGVDPLRQSNEHGMTLVVNTLRMMVGSQWAPQEVQFVHEAPEQTSEHHRIFRAPVLFGCETNALVIELAFIEREVPAADQQLYQIMKQYLDQVLSEMPPEDGFLSTIRKAIAESMRDGDPKLARVAKRVAMGPRTLQRRLKEYGFDFKKLVENTRQHFATSYLKDRKNSLTEVAFLLGYSELSAFNRAFKRWTRSTPLDYQRKMLRQE